MYFAQFSNMGSSWKLPPYCSGCIVCRPCAIFHRLFKSESADLTAHSLGCILCNFKPLVSSRKLPLNRAKLGLYCVQFSTVISSGKLSILALHCSGCVPLSTQFHHRFKLEIVDLTTPSTGCIICNFQQWVSVGNRRFYLRSARTVLSAILKPWVQVENF